MTARDGDAAEIAREIDEPRRETEERTRQVAARAAVDRDQSQADADHVASDVDQVESGGEQALADCDGRAETPPQRKHFFSTPRSGRGTPLVVTNFGPPHKGLDGPGVPAARRERFAKQHRRAPGTEPASGSHSSTPSSPPTTAIAHLLRRQP
jgi:hypothetical protein